MTVAEIKKIIMKHNHYASELLNTNHTTATNTAYAYKKYIDETPLIVEILNKVIELSKTVDDLFVEDEFGSISVHSSNEELEMMAMYYRHLDVLVTKGDNLSNYAFWIVRKKHFDDCISQLLELSVKPLINFINNKLQEIKMDAEEEERRTTAMPSYVGGDVITNSTVQKDIGGNAVMRDINSNKSEKHFHFQKESFFLGVVSAVVSGLLIWGIEELIKFLINI